MFPTSSITRVIRIVIALTLFVPFAATTVADDAGTTLTIPNASNTQNDFGTFRTSRRMYESPRREFDIDEATSDNDLDETSVADDTEPEANDSDDGNDIFDAEEESTEADGTVDSLWDEPTVLFAGQAKVGFTSWYRWQDLNGPILLDDGTLGIDRARIRDVRLATHMRYGIADGAEVFVDLPVRFLNVEFSDPLGEDAEHEAGLADINAGFRFLVGPPIPWLDRESLEFAITTDVTFPTGGDPFGLSSIDNAIDSGFWIFSAGLEFTFNDEENLQFYGGFAYSHYLPGDYFGDKVEKGDAISYWLGTSWYVTDSVSMSAEFLGEYQGAMQVNGSRIPASSIEPMALRFGVHRNSGHGRGIEPFVQFGVNDDRQSVIIGLTTDRFFR